MMPPQDDLRRAMREIGQELGKVIEQAGRMCRVAAQDLGVDWPPPQPPAGAPGPSPIELIRQLGELHEAGFLTDEEFQAKKAKLLEKI